MPIRSIYGTASSLQKVKESEERRKNRQKKQYLNRKERTKTYTVRVYYDSELMTALEKAAKEAGKQPGRYLRIALIEKLQRDGYITEIPEDTEEEVEE